MPRNFGEKSQMDAVHYMDPEDLLLLGGDLSSGPNRVFADKWQQLLEDQQPLELPTLPGHFADNAALLAQLAADGISYRYPFSIDTGHCSHISFTRYSRLDIEERLGEGMQEKAEEWNQAMAKHQRTLLKIAAQENAGVVQGVGSVGAITATAVAPPVAPLAVVASKAASKGAGGVLTADSNALLSSLLAVSEGDPDLII